MPRPGRLTSGKDAVPIAQEAGEVIWTSAEDLSPHQGSNPETFSLYRVATPTALSCLTDCFITKHYIRQSVPPSVRTVTCENDLLPLDATAQDFNSHAFYTYIVQEVCKLILNSFS